MNFRSEHVWSKRLHIEQNSSPVQKVEGHFWNDIQQKCLQSNINGLTASLLQVPSVNITPVTATDPNAEANLQTFALPAGVLNVVGKVLRFSTAGNYTTAGGQTPTIRIRAYLGSVAVIDMISAATTAAATTMPWKAEGIIVCSAVGASGTVEAHGSLFLTLGTTAAAAGAVYHDVVTAASSAIDLSAAQTFKLTALMSSSNAGNSVISRSQVLELAN